MYDLLSDSSEPPPLILREDKARGVHAQGATGIEVSSLEAALEVMIVYPRETPPDIRTARAQPPAAHRCLPPPLPQTRETQTHNAPTSLR